MTGNNFFKFYNEAGWLCPIHNKKLQVILKVMLKVISHDLGHISLYVVRDSVIMQINNEHLSCQGPTNVLSFPSYYAQGTVDNPHTIIISVDTLHRECLLYGQEKVTHFVHLLAHGLGHIAGYDHGDEMFALCEMMEDEAINSIQSQ